MDILGAEYVKVLFPNHFCRKMIIITFAAIVEWLTVIGCILREPTLPLALNDCFIKG